MPGRPQIVGVPQRATAERWESEPEDGADVAVARAAHDALAYGARRFVQDAQHEALQHFRRPRAAVRMDAEQLVGAGVHAALLAPAVLVESTTRLATEAPRLHDDVPRLPIDLAEVRE